MSMIGLKNSVTKQKMNVGYAAWSLVTGAIVALVVTRFKRRTLYMICTISLLMVYTGWTVAMQKATTAEKAGGHNAAASAASAFFIFAYQPCYNIGFNALTYTYMVEIWPYMERSRGIAVFQLFGRLAGFFTTFVNPIGLSNISWKWLIVYVAWLAYEVVFCWFMFPETANRTLEELAFCKMRGQIGVRMWFADFMQCLRARSRRMRRLAPWRRLLLCTGRTRLPLGRRARECRSVFGGFGSTLWADLSVSFGRSCVECSCQGQDRRHGGRRISYLGDIKISAVFLAVRRAVHRRNEVLNSCRRRPLVRETKSDTKVYCDNARNETKHGKCNKSRM
jgi:hypothetical protein